MDDVVHGVVLAGGRSTRMGRDKAELLYAGTPAIRRVGSLFVDLGIPFSLSLRDDQRELVDGHPVLVDRWDDIGPIGGIATALEELPGRAILAVPIDVPALRADHLEALITCHKTADACCFQVGGRAVPLPSLWRETCRDSVIGAIQRQEFALHRILDTLGVQTVDVDRAVLANVNEPADYTRFTGGLMP